MTDVAVRTEITMPVTERIATLKQRLSDLEWDGEDMSGPTAARMTREIEHLSGYERLGYKYEPNF